jgi:hypothetical protein
MVKRFTAKPYVSFLMEPPLGDIVKPFHASDVSVPEAARLNQVNESNRQSDGEQRPVVLSSNYTLRLTG